MDNNREQVINNLEGTLKKHPNMEPSVKRSLERKLDEVKNNTIINK